MPLLYGSLADNDQRAHSHSLFRNGQKVTPGFVGHCLDAEIRNL